MINKGSKYIPFPFSLSPFPSWQCDKRTPLFPSDCLSVRFKYHQVQSSKVTKIKSKNQDNQVETSYQISATVSQDESKINTEVLGAGRFIIATNVLDLNELSNDYSLREASLREAPPTLTRSVSKSWAHSRSVSKS